MFVLNNQLDVVSPCFWRILLPPRFEVLGMRFWDKRSLLPQRQPSLSQHNSGLTSEIIIFSFPSLWYIEWQGRPVSVLPVEWLRYCHQPGDDSLWLDTITVVHTDCGAAESQPANTTLPPVSARPRNSIYFLLSPLHLYLLQFHCLPDSNLEGQHSQ